MQPLVSSRQNSSGVSPVKVIFQMLNSETPIQSSSAKKENSYMYYIIMYACSSQGLHFSNVWAVIYFSNHLINIIFLFKISSILQNRSIRHMDKYFQIF